MSPGQDLRKRQTCCITLDVLLSIFFKSIQSKFCTCRGSTNLLSEALHMKIFARLASLAPGQLLSVGPESQQHIVQKLIEHATEQDSSAESAKDLASALGLIAGTCLSL